MDDQRGKRRPVTAAQWLAARAVSQGAPPMRRRVRAVISLTESGQRISGTGIDALVATMRMTERLETLATDRAGRVEAQDDEELAAVPERINGRIVELAEARAGQMGAARAEASPSPTAAWRLDRRRAAGAVPGRS